jgi:transposase
MAHIHKKMKKGRPYYYVRETARVNGKSKVVSQIYLGSAERIAQLASGGKAAECTKLAVEEYGALWLANLIDSHVEIAPIVDSVIKKGKSEKGPSLGEYFLYAALNRMIDTTSKRALPDWYRATAVQQIRPVDVDELTSERYFEKWDRVKEDDLQKIATLFSSKIVKLEKPKSGCFLFDTTNYYTYMAGQTDSDLAKRGKNKEGKDWLRQVGEALLVSREGEIPLFYREYEGNRHDSKLFARILDEVFSAMKRSFAGDLTVVFDKGMNSEDNIATIDAKDGMHFITTYSPSYAEELIRVKRAEFKPVETQKNLHLEKIGKGEDRLVAFRTSGEFWGKERTVVVTFNPLTAAKQRYSFDKKLLDLRDLLQELKSKLNQSQKWKEKVLKHYQDYCRQLHLPEDLYEVMVEENKKDKKSALVFRKDYYRIGRYIEKFGKNILITDHKDWSTDEVVRASLDRNIVEKAFRQSKDDDLVGVMPLRHWTDGKIRCHLFTCIVALTYLRLLEIRLRRAGLMITARQAIEEMQKLHSCLCWTDGRSNPKRMLEEFTPLQAQIISALGFESGGGVLQKKKS